MDVINHLQERFLSDHIPVIASTRLPEQPFSRLAARSRDPGQPVGRIGCQKLNRLSADGSFDRLENGRDGISVVGGQYHQMSMVGQEDVRPQP